MKVLFVFNKPFDPFAGGVERVTASVMRGLAEEGWETFYLQDTGTELLENGTPVDVQKFFEEHAIDVVVQQLAYNGVVARYLSQKNKQIPYVVAWHTAPPTWIKSWRGAATPSFKGFGGEAKRLLRLAFFPLFYYKEIKRFLMRWEGVLPRTSRVLLLSNAFAPDFQKLLHLPADKICAIPNPLSFSEIASPEILDHKEKEVVIVSRMVDLCKRISLALKIWHLVEADSASDGWRLKIIGDGENLQAYKKLAKTLNLRRMEFLGRQNPQPYYQKASLAMMTSSFEGWGLTLTESQQFGTIPLAFGSYASAKDIITDGENGFLIPYGNLSLYAKRLLELMQDSDKRIQMAKNCLESAQRFEIQKIVPQWKNLLQDVASKR